MSDDLGIGPLFVRFPCPRHFARFAIDCVACNATNSERFESLEEFRRRRAELALWADRGVDARDGRTIPEGD